MTQSNQFTGFQAQDFGELAGSTWRGRDNLAGLLATTLRQQLGRPYKSWGVRRRLELHLALEGQYDFYDAFPYAKLFVSTEDRLVFGFYVEAPPAGSPKLARHVHWQSFHRHLQQDSALQTALLSAMANHELTLADFYRPESGGALESTFRFRAGELCRRLPGETNWTPVPARALIRRVAALPEEQWVDLHVFATVEREAAIDEGPAVSGTILTVLRALAPLYEMTIAPEIPLQREASSDRGLV